MPLFIISCHANLIETSFVILTWELGSQAISHVKTSRKSRNVRHHLVRLCTGSHDDIERHIDDLERSTPLGIDCINASFKG
jgi:hypothetical protein